MSWQTTNPSRMAATAAKIAAAQEYEVEHFAQKYNITPAQARELIAKHGNNRVGLEQAVARLKDIKGDNAPMKPFNV